MSKTQSPQLHSAWIDHHALGIVKTLQKKGFLTYLVGGCVRDLLLGKVPKDYDIATYAKPNEVKKSIHNAYVIGKRFRLVLVKRFEQQFEVATFRRNLREDDDVEDLPPGDNIFGEPEDDARRRDFTVNGLFYDPIKEEVIDFVGGKDDLKAGVVRMIGEPNQRLVEDPIRILRALRLAHMIRFQIEPSLKKAIFENAHTLKDSALPRRREEILKFLRLPDPSQPFLASYDLGVLKYISPHVHEVLSDDAKADSFLTYLQSYHDKELTSPTELFSGLVLAYYRTMIESDPMQVAKSNDILEHPKLLPLMRDELGMFKYEQKAVAKALHMQPYLAQKEIFENRRGRRLAILRSEAFPVAIKLAMRDYVITPEDCAYWMGEFTNSHDEIEKHKRSNKKRRRRRPRKRKTSSPQDEDTETASTEP